MRDSYNQGSPPAPKLRYYSDCFAWYLVDAALLFFASCTFAYEFVLVTRLPAGTWYPSVIVALGASIALQFRYGERCWKISRFDSLTLGLIVLGVACSLINVVTLRPDPDDFNFFHRAVFGLLDLSTPIAIHNTSHDIKSLPAISPVHLTTSLEVVAALVAKALGIQPVFFYHQVVGSTALFIFPFIYFLIFRYLKFSQRASLLGVAIVVLLFAFSGDSHQDWGNFTLVRSWSGKCILIALAVPFTALLTFKFLRTGSTPDLLRMHFAALSAIGLSGTAFFLIPFIIAFSILGAVSYQCKQPHFIRRIVLLGSTLLFFAILFILIKAGVLPEVFNMDAWQLPLDGKGQRPELAMLGITLFVKKTTLVFYLISALGILWFYRRNSRIASFTISSLCIGVALVTPPISSILIKITLPMAYWRLAYASQMLLIIGVFTLLCFTDKKYNQYLNIKFPILLGAGTIVAIALLKTPAINSSIISAPHALKFPGSELNFATLIDSQIPIGAVAAMPSELIPTIGLLRPDIGFISTNYNGLETRHVFVNAGRESEGKLRIAAQQDLGSCGSGGQLKKFMGESPRLTVMVFPENCEPKKIISNLSLSETDWRITPSVKYQLWYKRGTDLQ